MQSNQEEVGARPEGLLQGQAQSGSVTQGALHGWALLLAPFGERNP